MPKPQPSAFPLRLTTEARDALGRLCRENDITLTALIEAFARLLAEDKTPTRARLVKLAHQIDVERKSRRP